MKRFKKSALLFSLAILGATGAILACADWYIGYDYDSSFTPEAYTDRSYGPLFLSTGELFYRIGYDEHYTDRFNKAIVSDWSAQLPGKFSRQELEFLLLNDSALTTVSQLYTALQQNQAPTGKYARLNMTDEKVRGFIQFLHYSKVIEASSTSQPFSWNYSDGATPVDPKVVAEMEALYGPLNDPFIRNRIWFQILKGYFYSKNKQGIIAFFERTKAAAPKNILYYRGLSYVAGVYYHNKDYVTSNYLYSQVFNECPPLRTVAAYNFHPGPEAQLRLSLVLAVNPDDKAALWALSGYYGDEKQAIQEIYKLDPASKHLDFLLTRLVNKVESKLTGDHNWKTIDEYRTNIRSQVDQAAVALVNQIATEGKAAKPDLWNLAAGYLNIFAGNPDATNMYFNKVATDPTKSDLAGKQLRLLKLVNTLFYTTTMDASAESKLLTELDWLYNTVGKSNDEVFRFHQTLDWSKRYVAALYTAQQNPVFAELFSRNEKFYRNGANLELMKAFLLKSDKSPWEQLCTKIYGITLSDIYEYQGIIALYVSNYDDAIGFISQSNGAKATLPGNPFNGKIKDCHDCEHLIKLPVPYTKLSLIQKMKEMQGHVDRQEDVYNNALLLANAYYNITYFGSERKFYDNAIFNQNGNDIDTYYHEFILNTAVANVYYTKASLAATTDEQRAKCEYMRAKCERNGFYYLTYYKNGGFTGDTNIDYKEWAGFKTLRTQYAATNFCREVIQECGYFAEYLKTH